MERINRFLYAPAHAASLAFFRIAFGLLMLWETVRYLLPGTLIDQRTHKSYSWVEQFWVLPTIKFSYPGLEWLPLPEGDGMTTLFGLMALLAVFVAVGLFHRIATTLFFLASAYTFFVDAAAYQNHRYLYLLLSFLIIFLPANRKWALDCLIWPKLKADFVPRWTYLLLQFQIGAVYLFGGIAKLHPDWLVRGEPLRGWLAQQPDFPLIGSLFTSDWMIFFLSWSGMLIDLLALPMLLFRQTRPWFLIFLLSFNLMNSGLFPIGAFPVLMIALCAIFFPPNWPVEMWNTLFKYRNRQTWIALAVGAALAVISTWMQNYRETAGINAQGFSIVPVIIAFLGGLLLVWAFRMRKERNATDVQPANSNVKNFAPTLQVPKLANLTFALLAVWIAIQVALPLRHYFIAGDVYQTQEGYRFSWHLKPWRKNADLKISVVSKADGQRVEWPAKQRIPAWQQTTVATSPDLTLAVCKYVESELLKKANFPDFTLRVETNIELNGRTPGQLFIDSTVDMRTATYRPFAHNDWVLIHEE